MKFISLFSGAGGLDLGMELAGWSCVFAADNNPAAIETLRQNQGKPLVSRRRTLNRTVIESQDVRKLRGGALLRNLGLSRGDVPLLVGGPPCQSWSSAGHQLGLDDPRGRLFEDFVVIAAECGVRCILFENVRGLLTARGPDGKAGGALRHIRQTLLDHGYQSTAQLLNAADFGVPQRRVRLFIIAFACSTAPSFPSPTHADPRTNSLKLVPNWKTLQDCLDAHGPCPLDEVIRPPASLHEALTDMQPGKGLRSPGKKETTRPGGHWGYRQGTFVADPSLPARTVTASTQQDWIRDPNHGLRRLTPSECAAIQTFPSHWEFFGSRATQHKLIGNAVPPLLAKHLGKTLAKYVRSATSRRYSIERDELLPLPDRLSAAIDYTAKEERRNGKSRRLAPARKAIRIVVND